MSLHNDKKGCKRIFIPKDHCYVSFEENTSEVEKAVVVNFETTRGETLVLDLDKDGKVIGIDLFAPGTKPCQPNWEHLK